MLASGVFAMSFSGVEFALTTFGAEYRKLHTDLMQRVRDLVAPVAQRGGRLDGGGEFGGHRLGRSRSQLFG